MGMGVGLHLQPHHLVQLDDIIADLRPVTTTTDQQSTPLVVLAGVESHQWFALSIHFRMGAEAILQVAG